LHASLEKVGLAGGTNLPHEFSESLAKSAAQVDAPWWEAVYRKAFGGFSCMHSVREDGWAQRGGIDRVVVLKSGKTVTIDEKVRDKAWNDFLWEYLSDRDRNIPGWCAKDLACDYIAYAFVPTQKCLLLPALQLRRAWAENGVVWIVRANRGEAGFRIVDADNGRYITRSVAVPLRDTFKAVREAMIVDWAQ
jgi:hypothetical protein